MTARGAPWSPDELGRFIRDYEAGIPDGELRRRFPGRTRNAFIGKIIKHQLKRPLNVGALALKETHPAVVEGRTLFPTRVRSIADSPAVLTPGEWHRKFGAVVTKGAWSGFPIYAVTLEERATCPVGCHHYRSCMGNGMPAAWRHEHGRELQQQLHEEIVQLQRRHPGGFAVRLHVLGDFYSVGYVEAWARWLRQFPALHVWGYTARDASDPIGSAVLRLANQMWDRFAIRLSAIDPAPERAITLWEMPDFSQLKSDEIIVCPAELGKTKGCNSCGLCWSPAARNKTIAFLAHGGGRRR